ncbi:hypothetical protein KQI88_15345 [Alkaliphilus sp. MSJ-5]|uniref:Sporulation protein YjcZ n=1 Tax=Alkaliphilus flagellatus TaxID=2841507 RepID=A0ABS6G5Z4_9FIRM|nr:hypothetical protein [Alkaliphilus flagellatus]MBU5677793.1 hypothetical protein [Alkaliphilus flagellatus]
MSENVENKGLFGGCGCGGFFGGGFISFIFIIIILCFVFGLFGRERRCGCGC